MINLSEANLGNEAKNLANSSSGRDDVHTTRLTRPGRSEGVYMLQRICVTGDFT